MNLRCLVAMHEWTGCKCSKCGKTRDESHDWTIDCEKCAKCGKTRSGAHTWEGCKCSKCGKVREEAHDWSADCHKCSKCGQTRTMAHKWNGCKCAACHITRNEGHNWNGEVCSLCGIEKSKVIFRDLTAEILHGLATQLADRSYLLDFVKLHTEIEREIASDEVVSMLKLLIHSEKVGEMGARYLNARFDESKLQDLQEKLRARINEISSKKQAEYRAARERAQAAEKQLLETVVWRTAAKWGMRQEDLMPVAQQIISAEAKKEP